MYSVFITSRATLLNVNRIFTYFYTTALDFKAKIYYIIDVNVSTLTNKVLKYRKEGIYGR